MINSGCPVALIEAAHLLQKLKRRSAAKVKKRKQLPNAEAKSSLIIRGTRFVQTDR